MIYETDANQMKNEASNFIFQQITELETRDALKDQVRVVGVGQEWKGWGSKAKHIYEELSKSNVNNNQLVIVSDSRDVLGNNLNAQSLKRLAENYEALTKGKPGAVVIGAEKQCCVSAMTHSTPGQFLNDKLERTGFEACNSGQSDCLHLGEKKQFPWVEKLEQLAEQRGTASKNFYPNSGIIVGLAKDIKSIYEILKMKETEDDQALFTELMIKRPDLVVMDYDQKIIGNNVWTEGMDGCIFDWDKEKAAFVHPITKNIPAFLHFQGKFYECYGDMAQHFGYKGDMKRKLEEAGPIDNYGGARVVFEQTLILTDQITISDAQTAVDKLNTKKTEMCNAIQGEVTTTGVQTICEDAYIHSNGAVTARRLAGPSNALNDVMIKMPYSVDGPSSAKSELQSELNAWAASVPTGITSAANTHSEGSFAATISISTEKKKSGSSILTLSKIVTALVVVFFVGF